jgi:hypothetical protein
MCSGTPTHTNWRPPTFLFRLFAVVVRLVAILLQAQSPRSSALRGLIALTEREQFWLSLRERAKANLLPIDCVWVAPSAFGSGGAPDVFAVVVDVATVANWEATLTGCLSADTYVVLLGAASVVRSRNAIGTVVAALNFDDAVARLRLVIRRKAPNALTSSSSALDASPVRSHVATLRPSSTGIPRKTSKPPRAAPGVPLPTKVPPADGLPVTSLVATAPPPSLTGPARPPALTLAGVGEDADLTPAVAAVARVSAAASGSRRKSSPPAELPLSSNSRSPIIAPTQNRTAGNTAPKQTNDGVQPLTTVPKLDVTPERYKRMSISKALDDGMKIDGAIAVAIADWNSGLTLGTQGGGDRLNIEVAASANCNVVKAKMTAMKTLGIVGSITDILITLDDQIHVIRPLRKYPELFYYIAFDKARGNLGLTRHRIESIEKDLTL